MRLWKTVVLIMGMMAQMAGGAVAQNAVPEHRYLYAQDVDFYGADLTNLFDTSEQACARACSAQDACVAFTFNQRNNACFPKSAITDQQPYAGALSARKVATTADVLAGAMSRAAALEFLSDGDLRASSDFVVSNARRFSFGSETVDGLAQALRQAEQSGDTALALRWAGKAAALSDRAVLWVAYARLALDIAKDAKRNDQRRLRREALWAAINGYLRSAQPAVQTETLMQMARALERTGRGRDMIPALRLAMATAPRDSVQAALDNAIGKYGFRIVEHRVDNNAAAPRICAEFSEPLAGGGVDYVPFVRVKGAGLAVQATDRQLCLDGVLHGQRYTMTFRAGLPAASGEVLHKDVPLTLYVRDRSPAARFAGRAFVLPRSADAALPVETVNVTTLDLRLRRVSDRNLVRAIRESYFGQPLSAYADDQFGATLAQEVWTGQASVQNELNVEMTTRLPLGTALADQPPGIFALSATVPGQDVYENPAALQWFVLSDLGLSTWSGVDGMQVAVRALSDTAPKAGVRLSLISRANAVLGEVVTDASGFAQFPAGLSRGRGAAAPALVMAQDGTTDIAFLPLTDPAFDLSDRGVQGHPPAPPIDTFLSTDRGAYRVGETIFATALTRDEQARALENLPLTAILKRPDGVEYTRMLSNGGSAGGHVFALPLGADVPRGAWRLDVLADVSAPALASQVLLVEDFLPERIDFDLSLPDAPWRLSDTPPLAIDVQYLFGAPGAGLRVDGDLRLRASRILEGWPGYQFGRHDSAYRTRSTAIVDAVTDADGRATVPLTLPKLDENPGQPLVADITLRVAEGSGRPVERTLTKPLRADTPLIGIKPGFDDDLPEGSDARFDLIAVGPDGTAFPMPVTWHINRVETQYQWYQLFGNWEWEPVTRRVRVATGEATLGAAPVSVTVPTEWGSYEIIVEHAGLPYAVSSLSFAAGWQGGDGATDTPDRLEMSLNRPSYRPGDTVTLSVNAEAEGVALISVLSNRVIARQVVPVVAGENTVPLDVSEDWGSGAYVTASVLRGMDVAAGLNPTRQLGVVHASILPGTRALDVQIDAPALVDGQVGSFQASVKVSGLTNGDAAYVTLAAVDVGVLNLTGFTPPDVNDHYFGQRRLGVELRDIYGRLIDGMNGALGSVRSGGDAGASLSVQSPPPTEKLLAFFAGPVPVGPDGVARIDIDKPAFNGTVKLMAIAWSPSAVGNSAADVIARDPVVISASLPRFLAPDDDSRLLLELVHADGPAGEMPLHIEAGAGLRLTEVPATVTLNPQGGARLSIPMTASQIGDPQITVTLTTPDGQSLRKTLVMPVRDNDPEIAVTRQFALGVGEKFTFDANVFAGLKTGTASATLTAGPLARFDVPGLLRQLDRYPYGCTEQVTSSALPLLYLSEMAGAAGLGGPGDIDKKVGQAIARVLTRQSSNGAFGLWSARSGEFWLDAYVTDFLSRARTQGYAVPDLAFSLAMDNLRNRISYAPDFEKGGQDIAYALLVLAREGAAQMGDLRYYADTKTQDFATPLAVAQLGAALAAYGDQLRADAMFRRAGAMLVAPQNRALWRADFGTRLRDRAAVLKLSVEAGSSVLNPADLVSLVHQDRRQLSTQEAAQVVMAAHALQSPAADAGLLVDGAASAGPVVKRLNDVDTSGSVIENGSATATDVTMTVYGVPQVAPPADGYGYSITRKSYTTEGAPASGPIKTGSRRVVVIEVTPFEEVGARLIVDDPLPAGFEIDNPNLIRSGALVGLDWLETATAETAEFRSDRFVAAVNHRSADPFRLAYVIRAITPGRYHHPAATVADMYRPEYRANTATTEVTVTP